MHNDTPACNVEGCNGSTHDEFDAPEHWKHGVAAYVDDLVDWELLIDEHGHAYGHVVSSPNSRGEDMTSEQVRGLARRVESVPAKLRALADEIDRRSAPEQLVERISRHVRGHLALWGFTYSTQLREVLEVSTQRARDLYRGRTAFTLDEMTLLSAFFDVPITDWCTQQGPQTLRSGSPEQVAAGMDRVVSLREAADS